VLRALGPNLAAAIGTWESQAGVRLPDVAQLVCSLHTTASSPQVSLVIQLQQPRSRSDLLAAWAAVQTKQHAGMDYFVGPAWSYYIPDQEAVTTFVMSSESLIHELIDAGDAAPLVRREFAELLQEIDAQRQVTILVAPDAFDYELPRLRSPSVYWPRVRDSLQWLWTSDTTAGLLSFHLADTFYVELRACGPAGLESDSIAERLRDRLARIPDQIETLLAQQYPPPYWRRVALRYPEMTRYATRYVRVGVENDQAIANLVLPGQAAHNLVFGAEMLLGSPAGNESEAIASSAPATRTPQTIEELLQQTRNLRFDQKSLEFAIQDFSVDIREDYPDLPFPFEIRILGADLQLGGITRNQQIANFTAEGQTIADILTRMLMRANPITTVTDPSEPDQKLVWVVAADPDDPVKRVVLITTRDAAQREGYKLPAPFQAK
jgi:hypothetical protein